jgi:cytoskeletal protein CcmA (bactofilin family)
MKCLSPLAASIFADGEASAAESHAATMHLAECSRCRDLVDALRQENLLLTNVLREMDQQAQPASIFGLSPTRALLLLMAAMLAARLAWQGLSFETPPEVQWLKSMGEGSWWQLLFTIGFYLRDNGTEIVKMITTLAVFAVIVLLLVSTTWLTRRRRSLAQPLLLVLLAYVLISPASALERRTGQIVTVRADETIPDSLIVSGNTVNVDGTVEGDLILFCRQGTVRGKVQGNIVSFSRNLQIEGEVGGSAFTFGQWVTLRGQTARNLFAFAQNLSLSSDGRVGSNLTAFASEVDVQGAVTQDLNTFSDSANVRGSVGRNFTAHGEHVILAAPARVRGNVAAYVRAADRLEVGQGVTIEGSRNVHVIKHRSRYVRPGFYLFQAFQLAAAWIVGMLLMWLVPGIMPGRFDGGAALGRRIGIGFLVLIATPVAIAIAAITLIGIPLALIALVVWLIAIYLAKIIVAAMIGRTLLAPGQAGVSGFALALFVGLLLVFVAFNVPLLGALVRLGVVVLGLGMAFEWVRRSWPRSQVPAIAQG